jgi:pyruvate kinase
MDCGEILAQLDAIIERARDLEHRFADALAQVHPQFRDGARNLVHYVALRKFDIRELQEQLECLGLSSLGGAEENVLASVRSIRDALDRITSGRAFDMDAARRELRHSQDKLDAHIDDMLGERRDGRRVRIMVTLPNEAASDYELVRNMIGAGMDIARINCAHDEKADWSGMVRNVQRARTDIGRDCKIFMDLAGPKIRTGDLVPGPRVVRVRRKRDALGKTVRPAQVCFVPEDALWIPKKCVVIPVPRECIDSAQIGDVVRLSDARGKSRKMIVLHKSKKGLRLSCKKTAYVAAGTRISLFHGESSRPENYHVGSLPPVEQPLFLSEGDTLILHAPGIPGEPALLDQEGEVIEPAHISCRQPEVFRFVAAGDSIRLNDGKIEGTVVAVSEDRLEIRVTHAKATGSRLRSDRGINFPDSDIAIDGLTETDKKNLAFIADNADAVSLSFIRKPVDILALQEELKRDDGRQVGIVAKIETVKAFKDLPRLLLVLMRNYPAAVMIARGDLAVECGWERMAEIQEEILWLCEAAQVPVIWATQVLEGKTKKGRPSRAEITDAAMSQRADCVMLNKGPYILPAIRMLDDILRRMQEHQHKKSPKLRKLKVSDL